MSKGYQPHLDGLRAIAVGLVVFYHAGFSGIGAGYIGVDVFFVLSGFLITGQLIKNLDEGSFSFTQFYTRRIRRLVPAFVVVAMRQIPRKLRYCTLGRWRWRSSFTSSGHYSFWCFGDT